MEGVRPPGYPSEYEVELVLSDGRQASVRPILPSDAAELEAAFRTADSATLWMRFLGPPPEPTPELLEWLTEVDYQCRFALVARDSRGRGIGIARWVADPGDDGAEVAVAVAPSWRRCGLATGLMILLARAAEERGFRAFTATFAGANTPVAELVEAAGATVETTGGLVRVRVELADLARQAGLPKFEPGAWTGFAEAVGPARVVPGVEAGVLKGDRGSGGVPNEPNAEGGPDAGDAADAADAEGGPDAGDAADAAGSDRQREQ